MTRKERVNISITCLVGTDPVKLASRRGFELFRRGDLVTQYSSMYLHANDALINKGFFWFFIAWTYIIAAKSQITYR